MYRSTDTVIPIVGTICRTVSRCKNTVSKAPVPPIPPSVRDSSAHQEACTGLPAPRDITSREHRRQEQEAEKGQRTTEMQSWADRHVGQQEMDRHIPQTRRPDPADDAPEGHDKVFPVPGQWSRVVYRSRDGPVAHTGKPRRARPEARKGSSLGGVQQVNRL